MPAWVLRCAEHHILFCRGRRDRERVLEPFVGPRARAGHRLRKARADLGPERDEQPIEVGPIRVAECQLVELCVCRGEQFASVDGPASKEVETANIAFRQTARVRRGDLECESLTQFRAQMSELLGVEAAQQRQSRFGSELERRWSCRHRLRFHPYFEREVLRERLWA